LLDEISYVENTKVTLHDVCQKQNLTLDINTENINSNISFSDDSIELFINVEQFTEAELEVPLEVIKETADVHLRIFPDKVNITYFVALTDYKKVDADMFDVVVKYNASAENKTTKLKVQLIQKPKYIKVTKINPEKVEFIIYK